MITESGLAPGVVAHYTPARCPVGGHVTGSRSSVRSDQTRPVAVSGRDGVLTLHTDNIPAWLEMHSIKH